MEQNTTPKMVTITRTFTYDVTQVIETFQDIWNTDNPRWEDIEAVITGWVDEDMRSPIHPRELVWTDEEGQEL